MRWELMEDGLRVHTPAKLNLYLEIVGKRPDGYHDIDSIFQAVSLHDVLEFRPTWDGSVKLEEVGMEEGEKNLVHRAARLLKDELLPSGSPHGVRIRLTKRIPEGAGLGGGSSDAAATLLAVARLWRVDASDERLRDLAARLGSDVPFFLVGGTARCRCRGDLVESLAEAFDHEEPFHYVLVYPKIKVSTRMVYGNLAGRLESGFTLTPSSCLDSMRPDEIRARLRDGSLFFNRFEGVVYEIVPELKSLHDFLSGESFVRVLMSGSGSTVYGLCRSAEEAQLAAAGLRGRLDADVIAASSERCHVGLEGVRGTFREGDLGEEGPTVGK